MNAPALDSVIAGKYRVERVLGRGGMGVIVQAHHVELEQSVAIKLLSTEQADETRIENELVERFVREARAVAKLKSEHVARVMDVGTLESGAPYMVLEYLEGSDLARLPARLATGEVVDLMLQACEALAEAHAVGIVHRDLKPANLFVTQGADGPHLKVLDFGISKMVDQQLELTATRSVLGTPAYMSPEQMRSTRNIDARSDIWALGVVLYELLEGRRPFAGDSYSELVLAIANEEPAPMSPELPEGLAAVVRCCLEKNPDLRYQSVAQLAAALAPHAGSAVRAQVSVARARRISSVPAPQRSLVSFTMTGHAPATPPPALTPRRAAAGTLPPALVAPTPSSQTAPKETTLSHGAGTQIAVAVMSGKRWPYLGVVLAAVAFGIAFALVSTRSTNDTAIAPAKGAPAPVADPDPAPAPEAAPEPAPAAQVAPAPPTVPTISPSADPRPVTAAPAKEKPAKTKRPTRPPARPKRSAAELDDILGDRQ